MTYNQLMEIAMKELRSVDTAPERLPVPLVYVLETKGGNIRTVINDDFKAVLDALAQSKDTVVNKVLAVWKGGVVDVPSYAFRKALLMLDDKNANTEILLRTEGGYAPESIAAMM